MNDEKSQMMASLVAKRRLAQLPLGYSLLSDFHEGRYECDYVSPWTKCAHNLCAEVMVIAQDWASENYLRRPFDPALGRLGYDHTFPTNTDLRRLLNSHLSLDIADLYATNLFPFIKPGELNATIRPESLLVTAAREYATPQIEAIEPLVAVCLGITTFRAIHSAATALGTKMLPLTWPQYEEATSKTPTGCMLTLKDGIEVFAVTHLGSSGKIGRHHKVAPEWEAIASRLKQLRDRR